MQIRIHLMFGGQCEAAFRFYQRVLGGELTTLMTYGESPLAAATDPSHHAWIFHATLALEGQELLGADVITKEFLRPYGFAVLLSVAGFADAQRVFGALSDGGSVQMPFQKTFWADGYGFVTDRFGVPWEITT
jgi:PhnB protein